MPGDGKVAAGFRESYEEVVPLPSAQAESRRLFLGLADESRLLALFHCTTGKGRTERERGAGVNAKRRLGGKQGREDVLS